MHGHPSSWTPAAHEALDEPILMGEDMAGHPPLDLPCRGTKQEGGREGADGQVVAVDGGEQQEEGGEAQEAEEDAGNARAGHRGPSS